MDSVSEVEIISACTNYQDTIPIRNTLIKLNYLQLPTLVQANNRIAVGFINKEIK